MTIKKVVKTYVILVLVVVIILVILGCIYLKRSGTDKSDAKACVKEYLIELQNEDWDSMLVQSIRADGTPAALDELNSYVTASGLDKIKGMDVETAFITASSSGAKWKVGFVYQQISYQIVCKKVDGVWKVYIE